LSPQIYGAKIDAACEEKDVRAKPVMICLVFVLQNNTKAEDGIAVFE
jgi:hypothetical protein